MIKLVLLAGALSLSLSGAAFADNSGKSGQSNASSCGTYHGDQADVNGPPAIGAGGAPSLHGGLVGQEHTATMGATGYNNSHGDCQAGLNNPS